MIYFHGLNKANRSMGLLLKSSLCVVLITLLLVSAFMPMGAVAANGDSGNTGTGQSGNRGTGTSGSQSQQLNNPLGPTTTLSEFFTKFLGALIKILSPIVVLAIIYTGFLFVRAQGKPEELVRARSALLWTLVGALLILGAIAISEAIEGTVRDLGNRTEVHQRISISK
jgi:nucleoside recognition membrane protein YjiH